MAAIEHANRLCQWQENLMDGEMPPEWCWHLDDVLQDWFEDVEAKRREKYGIEDQDETPELTSNEWSRGRR